MPMSSRKFLHDDDFDRLGQDDDDFYNTDAWLLPGVKKRRNGAKVTKNNRVDRKNG